MIADHWICVLEKLEEEGFMNIVKKVASAFNAQQLVPFVKLATKLLIAELESHGFEWAVICHYGYENFVTSEEQAMRGIVLYALYLLVHQTGRIPLVKFLNVLKKMNFDYKGLFNIISDLTNVEKCQNRIVNKILKKFKYFNAGYSSALRDLLGSYDFFLRNS